MLLWVSPHLADLHCMFKESTIKINMDCFNSACSCVMDSGNLYGILLTPENDIALLCDKYIIQVCMVEEQGLYVSFNRAVLEIVSFNRAVLEIVSFNYLHVVNICLSCQSISFPDNVFLSYCILTQIEIIRFKVPLKPE